MINQGMIDQGAQALAERIGKLDADLFRGAAEAVLRAALSAKPSPGDRTRTGQTARGEGCDLAPPLSNAPVLWIAKERLDRITEGQEEPWVYSADQSHLFECVALYTHPAPSTHVRMDVDRLATRIVTAACELDGPADPAGDDTISITMKDLEAVVHRDITATLENQR